jgi:hypothetical protein
MPLPSWAHVSVVVGAKTTTCWPVGETLARRATAAGVLAGWRRRGDAGPGLSQGAGGGTLAIVRPDVTRIGPQHSLPPAGPSPAPQAQGRAVDGRADRQDQPPALALVLAFHPHEIDPGNQLHTSRRSVIRAATGPSSRWSAAVRYISKPHAHGSGGAGWHTGTAVFRACGTTTRHRKKCRPAPLRPFSGASIPDLGRRTALLRRARAPFHEGRAEARYVERARGGSVMAL